MSKEERVRTLSVPRLVARAGRGEKLVALTAYDALFARLQDEAGVDILLVGDSVGNVYGGHRDTLKVTLDQMLYHTACVSRGVKHALVVGDMPFMSVQTSERDALVACGRMISEGGAAAVKIEGGRHMTATIHRLVECGIPVMGHIGLTPQSIHKLGGWGTRGRREEEAQILYEDACLLQEAGCFSIVLEKVEPGLAARITHELKIPTIGIGSGADCNGQVLVNMDMLGLFEDFKPAFVRQFAELAGEVRRAVGEYAEAVREGSFPGQDEV